MAGGEQADHQAVGFTEDVAVRVCHRRGDEGLPPINRIYPTVRDKWLVDRRDLAVVDVQVGGAAVGPARGRHDHPEMPVEEQRDDAAVHGVVAADVEAAEVAGHDHAVGP